VAIVFDHSDHRVLGALDNDTDASPVVASDPRVRHAKEHRTLRSHATRRRTRALPKMMDICRFRPPGEACVRAERQRELAHLNRESRGELEPLSGESVDLALRRFPERAGREDAPEDGGPNREDVLVVA
jgi:hypothetical protein